MRVSIIGGGNIGGAMALGMAESGIIPASNITVADMYQPSLDRIKVNNANMNFTTNNQEAIADADLVIVAVKPWVAEDVIRDVAQYMDFEKQMFMTTVPGITIKRLQEIMDKGDDIKPVVFRVMINTAISRRKSVNILSGSRNASPYKVEAVKALFNTLGKTFYAPETLQPAATSLTSCGIAFALKYLADSMTAGIEVGFTKQDSREMVIATMEGALELLRAHNSMPEEEIKIVTTPNGLTLKGLEAMAAAGFTEAVREGVVKSV
ncbi:MAG: pyrroline-5-carboxylate reductase dimerization domain-containing protein [Rikenellaceae bacterium]